MDNQAGPKHDPADGRSWTTVLRHPLVVGAALALFSGLLASLLIPALTRVWQDRPKELALKRGLVEKISESATDAVTRARYFGFNADQAHLSMKRRREFYSAAIRRWEIESAAIDSELTTYFHDTKLPRQWLAFVGAVNNYVFDSAYSSNTFENSLRDYLRKFPFDDPEAERVTTRALAPPSKERSFSYPLSYVRIQIDSRIVAANAAGFSHGFWIFR